MDIHLVNCGHEQCQAAHSYGPGVRDHYLIHYIQSGKGTYTCESGTYAVTSGQGFLITPGSLCYYRADDIDPWTYHWAGYAGPDAHALTREAGLDGLSVFSAEPRDELCTILAQIEADVTAFPSAARGEMCARGGLYRFLFTAGAAYGDERSGVQPVRQQIYEKACWYQRAHFDRAISVQETAAFVGLSRSQLFRVFKACSGQSPVEHLMVLRLESVQALLINTQLTIKDISLSCGFSSSAHLCAFFREREGVSPGEYRKNKPSKE